MHLQDRWKRIIDELSSERVTSVDELTERLGVSPATIRRDLNELHELGHLLRVRGGAMRSEGKLYSGREEKRSEGLRGQSSFSDSVRSTANQATNTTASALANSTVLVIKATPRLSTRLSDTSVPTTLISTTASQ